jgi:hypothetical protein
MSKHETHEAVSVPTISGPGIAPGIANDETRENDAVQTDATQLLAGPGCIKADDQLSYRVMDNCPGPGWHWEVLCGGKIVARGLAVTRHKAVAQVAAAVYAQNASPLRRST